MIDSGTAMLEMWVSPQDLFRPCPDTEISDTVCETGFPSDSFRMLDLNNTVRATEGTATTGGAVTMLV